MTLLSTTAEVAALCTELAREPYVAVDTEFMRDRTYWPKLCLVQLAGAKRHAAIDPLATGIDLAPLFALMADPQVLKVFHAARQDIEVFHRLTGEVPTPLFDTQLAAMVCGYGEEVGYETLVSQIAKGRVDKSSRFTDWSRRPLSAQQLAYALGDVIHLRVIYERLRRQLEQTGRSEWVAQELADLTDPATYRQPLGEAWKRIKVRSRDPRFLAVLRALATWREAEAQRRDLPRNRVIRDDLLLEVAANRPTSVEQLAKLRRISLDRQSAAAVVEAVHAALALPEHELPRLEAPPKLPRGHRPDDRPAAGAAQAEERGASRRAAPGRHHRRPRGDRDPRAPGRRRAERLALRGIRPLGARAQARRARARHRRRSDRPHPHRRSARVRHKSRP